MSETKTWIVAVACWFVNGVCLGCLIGASAVAFYVLREPVTEPIVHWYQDRVVIEKPFWRGMHGEVVGYIHRPSDGKCEYLVHIDLPEGGFRSEWFTSAELSTETPR